MHQSVLRPSYTVYVFNKVFIPILDYLGRAYNFLINRFKLFIVSVK